MLKINDNIITAIIMLSLSWKVGKFTDCATDYGPLDEAMYVFSINYIELGKLNMGTLTTSDGNIQKISWFKKII